MAAQIFDISFGNIVSIIEEEWGRHYRIKKN
jgi:hypothetical protein